MRRLLIPAAALSVFALQAAAAQSCSISGSPTTCDVATAVQVVVPSLLTLNMQGFTTGQQLTLTAPGLSDFNASGLATTTTSGINFTVKANRAWRVQIKANADAFTGSNQVAAYSKPISDVQWGTGAAFTTLTTTSTDVASGDATAASSAVNMSYKVAFDITKDKPGTYDLGITYTLVAP